MRKELSIAQQRLQVSETAVKAHESREHVCKQDLELAAAELRAAAAREAEAEKALRQNDCAAVKRDLRAYRDRAEEAEVEKESLKRRLSASETRSEEVAQLQNTLAAAQTDRAAAEAAAAEAEAARSVAARRPVPV